MVRVYGPAMSLDASGTLANTLVFSKWKGRNYVRERVIPSNPKSGAQIGRRAMMKFLSQEWAGLAGVDQATWQDVGDNLVASPFNAFVSANMKDWHNFLLPTMAYPTIRNGIAATDGDDGAAVWEENRIKITMTLTLVGQNWGKELHASLVGAFTPAVGNVFLLEPNPTLDTMNWYWTPPEVGTWYFRGRNFSTDGNTGIFDTEFSAVP